MDDIYDLYTDSDHDRQLTADEVAGGDLIGGIVDVSDDYDSADGTSKVMTHTEHSKAVRNVMVGLGNTWTAEQTFADVRLYGQTRTDPAGVDSNTLLGLEVLSDGTRAVSTDVNWVVGIGYETLLNVEEGVSTVAVGAGALRMAQSADNVVAIGTAALSSYHTGIGSNGHSVIAIGDSAAGDVTDADDSILLGNDVLSDTSVTVDDSIIMGAHAYSNQSQNVTNSIMIGSWAASPTPPTLWDPATAVDNIICIGQVAPPSDSVTSDFLNIGDFLRGDMDAGEFYQPIPNAAPDDGDLSTSEGCLHVDEVNDHLAVKMRYSDDTLHEKSIASSHFGHSSLLNDFLIMNRLFWSSVNATVGYTDGPLHGEGDEAYAQGALLQDGRVVLCPDKSPYIGLFDPTDDSYTRGPAHGHGDYSFGDAIVLLDGRVCFPPMNAQNIGLFDPTDDSYSDGPAVTETDIHQYAQGLRLTDGRVLFAPKRSEYFGLFDPTDDSYTRGPAHGEGSYAFCDGVQLPDGRVCCVPKRSDYVGLFDPTDDSYTRGPASDTISVPAAAFTAGQLMLDGRVVFSPYYADYIGLFNPADDSYTTGPAHGEGEAAYGGLLLMPDGRIVLSPSKSDYIGIFDPNDDSYSRGPAHGKGDYPFAGVVPLPDGRAVMPPPMSDNIGIITTGLRLLGGQSTARHLFVV